MGWSLLVLRRAAARLGGWVLGCAILLTVTGCAVPTRPDAARVPPRTDVPFKLQNGVPVVEVRINDRGPYKVLLDTGAGAMRLSQRVVEEIGLEQTPVRYKSKAPTGSRAEMAMVRVDRLELAGAVFEGFEAPVVGKLSYKGIDGVLGMEVFNGCTLALDFPAKKITLAPGGTLKRGHGFKDANPRIPMVVGNGDRKEIMAVVDTGFNGVVALTDEMLPRTAEAREAGADTTKTSAGVDIVRVARIQRPIFVGPATIDPPVDVAVVDTDALVGMGVLKHCRVVVDLRNNRVVVEESTNKKRPDREAKRE
jgi:predicted aspartyl protease